MKLLNLILLAGSIASANEATPTSEEPTSSVEEPTSSVVVSSEATSEEQETSFEEFKQQVTDWLSQYLEKDLVVQIISWAVDVGVLGGLFTVYLKYRKYKGKTIEQLVDEVKAKVTETMENDFKNLSKEQQEKLINGLETLKKSNELVIKALVLAQSKTTDSKLALLDLVSESNTNVEVKEAVEQVREEIQANEEQKQKVQEAVKEDYNPID